MQKWSYKALEMLAVTQRSQNLKQDKWETIVKGPIPVH